LEQLQQLQSVGINVPTMQKGAYYSEQQVLDAYEKLEPKFAEKMQRYKKGEIRDPTSYAFTNVKTIIERLRNEMGLNPLVMRMHDGGLRVLTDAEAVTYLNNQANAGIKKHKTKTEQLFTHVDAAQLDEKSSKQLEAHQRRHAFIAASAQGARTQALKMQRKGVQLPKP
jgi:hypothetical protein